MLISPKISFLPWQAPTLERALELKNQARLPHAVLIDMAGEADLGEFSQALAMLLLCDQTQSLELCGVCDACRLIPSATYADFNSITLDRDEIPKSKQIKIEQIRDLIHQLGLTRQYQGIKIATIFPAEAMNSSSANALLKTLEEPTPGTLLILLTRNRGRIPLTLRSRCQYWPVKLPTWNEALAWLGQQGVDESTAKQYLVYANGDPVLAMRLKQQDYAALISSFKTRFSEFLNGENSASGVSHELMKFDLTLLQRLLNMTLTAYCYQMSGLDAEATAKPGADRIKARQLLELRQCAQNQLAIQENNLDPQLQLEDVLISLKQILKRRMN